MRHAPTHIRGAMRADLPALAKLRQAVLAEGRYFIQTAAESLVTKEQLLAEYLQLERRTNSRTLVAVRAGKLIGALWLTGSELRRLRHVTRLEIMVSAEVRGQGVGRRLIREGIAWAQGEPVVQKISLSVFADNQRAWELYRYLGFVEEGRRIGEYMEEDGHLRDDILMSLSTPTPSDPFGVLG